MKSGASQVRAKCESENEKENIFPEQTAAYVPRQAIKPFKPPVARQAHRATLSPHTCISAVQAGLTRSRHELHNRIFSVVIVVVGQPWHLSRTHTDPGIPHAPADLSKTRARDRAGKRLRQRVPFACRGMKKERHKGSIPNWVLAARLRYCYSPAELLRVYRGRKS